MTMSIRLSKYCKNGALLVIILLMVACKPPSASDNQQSNQDNKQVNSPIFADSDSVTMAADYILSIKPSRYQPSLGLQGVIEPVQQSRFITASEAIVQEVLVTEGQWVEEGAPLLIVKRQWSTDEPMTTVPMDEKQPENNNKDSNMPINKTEAGSTATITIDNGADNRPIQKNIDSDSDQIEDNQDKASLTSLGPPIIVRASFSGRVENLYVEAGQQVDKRTSLLHLSDDKDLRFIAKLPIKTKPKLSVGQAVNFTAKGLSEQFAGQVSKLVASEKPDELYVYVHVVRDEANRDTLKPDMVVTGRVDYGQIEVGTIVPEQALHNVDLSVLKRPPYQSLMPLNATVWIIKQDQRLTQQPVEVIKYEPSTEQYLIAGVSNDSLICLADLPKTSAGKKVVIS